MASQSRGLDWRGRRKPRPTDQSGPLASVTASLGLFPLPVGAVSRRLSGAHRPGAVGGRGGLPLAGLAAPHRAERGALVAQSLKEHTKKYDPLSITLPWEDPFSDERVTVPLIFTTTRRSAIKRATFDGKSWRPAVEAAGIVPSRATGMHALRHFYASALLDAGESIRVLASYLGHSDPGFTLRVYTHLMPASEERTRRAIDDLFQEPRPQSDLRPGRVSAVRTWIRWDTHREAAVPAQTSLAP